MKDLEMLTTLLDADSEHLWLTTLFSLANSIGIEKMLFALVQNRFAGIESAYLHSNYPSSWRKIYDDKNLFHFDPTVAHCFANSNPLIWNKHLSHSVFLDVCESFWEVRSQVLFLLMCCGLF